MNHSEVLREAPRASSLRKSSVVVFMPALCHHRAAPQTCNSFQPLISARQQFISPVAAAAWIKRTDGTREERPRQAGKQPETGLTHLCPAKHNGAQVRKPLLEGKLRVDWKAAAATPTETNCEAAPASGNSLRERGNKGGLEQIADRWAHP